MAMNTTPPLLYDLALPELEALLHDWQQPAFRARQLYRQLYVNLAADVQAMSDLPRALRERLAAETCLSDLRPVRVQQGDQGMTRKALFALDDEGAVIETVLMVYPDQRATVCVSTQAGCAMGCVFCATAKLGLLKNLSPGQIVAQALWAARTLREMRADPARFGIPPALHESLPENLTNLVFMGMGEPFANYDRWWEAVERLHDPNGVNLGARNLTVSTVGLAQGIRRLAGEALPINLAISLHAPNDELRGALMPVNRRYPLAELFAATHEYLEQSGRRVSFEYVLLQQQNDTPELAAQLADLLHGRVAGVPALPLHLVHVNLIPWNPVPGEALGRSERRRVLAFQQILQDQGIACTVRVERGVEIAAACGQLAGNEKS
jgi:23S rRNA (adenine2503-C2)-methyltransferase